ncbi:uncharacterized protein C1orf105 homolog isoform X4 [Notamacropus eugenii]|uniref:uncharacterized protein C1orf105 homolog isoform X4 n=1 Tax=Notamacropus eugenii TaxID=9315 RepID=UPI003B677911
MAWRRKSGVPGPNHHLTSSPQVPFKIPIIKYDTRNTFPYLVGNKPLLITLRKRSPTFLPTAADTKKDLTLPSLFQMPEASHQAAQGYLSESEPVLDLPVIDQYPLCPDCMRMKAERLALKEKDSRYQGLPHFIKPTKKMVILDAPKHLQLPLMDFMSEKSTTTKHKSPVTTINEDIDAENVQYRLQMRAIWGPKKPIQTLYTDLIASSDSTRTYKKESPPDPKSMWTEFNIKIPKHSKYY